jgi:hypothetical protein
MLVEVDEALIPGEQEITLMEAVAGAMARAGVLDEPPSKASSKVEEELGWKEHYPNGRRLNGLPSEHAF